jgi:multiple sugar transport system permease protein
MIYFSVTINGQFDQFQGIKNLLTSNIFMMAMKNTLIFSVIGIFGLITLALILSLIISKMTLFKGLIQTVLLSPLVIPTASIIMIWNIFFNSSGLVNDMLIKFNQSPIDFYNSSYSFLNVLLLFFWKNLGYITLILSAAIENVDTAQYEAASIDGANGLQKAFHITLPNIKHALIFVFVITMVNSFKAFREIYLLMGQYPHESIYSLQHYMNNLFEVMDYQKLSIIALSVLVLIVTVVLIILRLEKED